VRRALLAVGCALALGPARPAAAQDAPAARAGAARVLVDAVLPVPDPAAVDVRFRALTAAGSALETLTLDDVRVRQDDAELDRDALLSLAEAAEAGVDVAIAFDTSRTMLGAPFERARTRALALLAALAPTDRAALVAFSDRVELLAPLGEPREALRARLEALEPNRAALSTLARDGLARAVELLREAAARPGFVVAFTDGRDGGSRRSLEQLLALAAGGPGEVRVPVFASAYEGRGGDGLAGLERLASASGGAVSREAAGTRFYEDALAQLRGSRVVRVATALDGALHHVAVEVGGVRDERVASYTAPEPATPAAPRLRWQLPVLALAAALALVALALRWWGRRRGGARLRCVDGPLAPRTFALRGERSRLGALASNDVTIDGPDVSRVHAEIRREGDGYVLVDLGSTNGTRLNGAAITSSPLRPGDRIGIGEVELVFEA
jgi:hypothetical protein